MIKKIIFDTYPISLYIFIDETDEAIVIYTQVEDITELSEDLLNFEEGDGASFSYKDTSNIAIRFRNIFDTGMVVHEAFHAAAYIMRYVGIRYSKSSEEAYAYLLQYIVDNIYD